METFIGISIGIILIVIIHCVYLLGYRRGFDYCTLKKAEEIKSLMYRIDELEIKASKPIKQTEDDEEIEQILALFDYQQGDFKKDKGGK